MRGCNSATEAGKTMSYSINTKWYLQLNALARESPWAHGFMEVYAHLLGVGLLALVLVAAWWWSRRSATPARAVARILWVAAGTVIAWVIAHYELKPLVESAVAAVLGLLLCFGRVYTGMHYPFDVVGGFVIGGIVVAVLWPLAVPTLTAFDKLIVRTPLAVLVQARHRPRT